LGGILDHKTDDNIGVKTFHVQLVVIPFRVKRQTIHTCRPCSTIAIQHSQYPKSTMEERDSTKKRRQQRMMLAPQTHTSSVPF
jgi:hypothetical protein